MSLSHTPRPPIVTQPPLEVLEVLELEPEAQLVAAVDQVASAWAYWITSDGATRRDARELLGAAIDALLIARNRLEGARRG